MKIAITGAAGRIGYNVIFRILNKEFIPSCSLDKISISCIDIEIAMEEMRKIIEEVQDCNFPSLQEITKTTDFAEGVKGADLVILISSAYKKPNTPRVALLRDNAEIFKGLGGVLNKEYKRQIGDNRNGMKVLVVANPANTNCLLTSHFAPDIPKRNFSSLSRLDFQRACVQFSLKTKINLERISDLIILGNHSGSQVPVCSLAKIDGEQSTEVCELFDSEDFINWGKNEFRNTVRYRNDNIEKFCGYSSVCSAATATIRQAKDMVPRDECKEGPYKKWTVMGVYSDGSYGFPKDLFISMPVYLDEKEGTYEIAKDAVELNDEARAALELSFKELIDERDQALGITT